MARDFEAGFSEKSLNLPLSGNEKVASILNEANLRLDGENLRCSAIFEEAEYAHWDKIEINVNEQVSTVFVPRDLLQKVLARLGFTELVSEWPDQLCRMIYQWLLSAKLETGENKVTLESCQSAEKLELAKAQFLSSVELGGESSDHLPIYVLGLQTVFPSLGDAQKELVDPDRPNLEAQRATTILPLSVQTPIFQISLGSLLDAYEGDVILLDNTWKSASDRTVHLGAEQVWSAARQRNGKLKLSQQMMDRKDINQQKDEIFDDNGAVDQAVFDQREILINLSVELGRTKISLGEMEQLKPGSVLPNAVAEPDVVRVLANGRFFSLGRIVKYEGNIGIQLFTPDPYGAS